MRKKGVGDPISPLLHSTSRTPPQSVTHARTPDTETVHLVTEASSEEHHANTPRVKPR